MYNSDSGEIKEWNIPYNAIEKACDAGEMKTYMSYEDGREQPSGIHGKEDITMSHVLQASLRMGTILHKDIMKTTSMDEKLKLLTIFIKMKNLTGYSRRPIDYPIDPKIAIICGSLASRGNSIQNPFIGFTFTSSLYYNNNKSAQRGAINCQMSGRSNGTLLESYTSSNGIKPIMISTKTIMRDSLANEAIVMDKAKEIANGDLIYLKDLVTDAEWKLAVKNANEKCVNDKIATNIKNIYVKILNLLNSSDNGSYNFTTKHLIDSDYELNTIVNNNRREILTRMSNMNLIENINKGSGIWKITEFGKQYIIQN